MQHERGFTLIDIMVSMMIMVILTAIAMPAYKGYVIRAKRGAVQGELMQIANGLERYKAMQLTYSGATLSSLYGASQYPKTGTALYNLTLGPAALSTSWYLVAQPVNTQQGDGTLVLMNNGQKCWYKATDSLKTDCSTGSTDGWSVASK